MCTVHRSILTVKNCAWHMGVKENKIFIVAELPVVSLTFLPQ